MSSSGANKSAVLGEFQACIEEVRTFRNLPSAVATDYTVEAIQSLMGDTNGTAVLILDEMAKIKAADEFKKQKGGGKQRLMELQAGQKIRVLRKGGGGGNDRSAEAAAEEEEEEEEEEETTSGGGAGPSQASTPQKKKNKRGSVTITTADSHMVIFGTTHTHTGVAWYKEHQGQTDGEMTRFDTLAVDAEYEDLPDCATMEQLGGKIADGIDLFLFLSVVAVRPSPHDPPLGRLTDCASTQVVRNVLVADVDGDVFLDLEGGYERFQRTVNQEINVALRELPKHSAGGQTSSLSKTKGKTLRYSGGSFIAATALVVCDDAAVQAFDFDLPGNDCFAFDALVEPIVRSKLGFEPGVEANSKLITAQHVEYGTQWAMMFHENGTALQKKMVQRVALPTMAAVYRRHRKAPRTMPFGMPNPPSRSRG